MRNKDHMQYKKILDQKLKIGPENHILSLREQIIQDIKQQNEQKIKNWIKAIKMIIKDRISAKPKFYALLLLKEMLATKDKIVVEYFVTKLRQRLFLIANHKSKSHLSLEERGKDCLRKYYKKEDKENIEYQIKFFILLWECWKEWDLMFAEKIKEIKKKTKILEKDFRQQKQYYDYFEDKFGLERDHFKTVDHYSILYDSKSNFNTNQSNQERKTPLLDQVFQKNIQDLQQEIEKLSHIFGNKSNAQRYNFQDFELINQNLQQSQNYFQNNNNNNQVELLNNKEQDQLQKDFLFFENTLSIFDKFKTQQIDEKDFKQYMYQLYSQYYHEGTENQNQRKFGTLQSIKEESKELEESKYNREASINTKRKSIYSIEWSKKDDMFSEFDKKPKEKRINNEEYQKHDYSPQLTKSMKKQGNTPLKKKNYSQYSLRNDQNFSQMSKQFNDKQLSQNDFDFQKTSRSKFKKQEMGIEINDDQINFDDFQDFQTEQNFSSRERTDKDVFKKQQSDTKKNKIEESNEFENFDNLRNFKRKSEQINRNNNNNITNDFDNFNHFDDFNDFDNFKVNKNMEDTVKNDIKTNNENLFDDFNNFQNNENQNQDNISANISNTKQSQYEDNDETQQINFDDDDEIDKENKLEENLSFNDDFDNQKNEQILDNKKQKISKQELDDFDNFNDFDNLQFNEQKLQEINQNEQEKQNDYQDVQNQQDINQQESYLQDEFKSFKIDTQRNQEDSYMQTQPKNILNEEIQINNNIQQQEQKIQLTNEQQSQNKDKINDMFDFDNFQQQEENKQQQIQEDWNVIQKKENKLEQEFNFNDDFDFPINNIQENTQKDTQEQFNNKQTNSQRSSKKQSFKNDEVLKTINKINQIQSDDEGDYQQQSFKIQKIKINRNKESIYEIQSNNLDNIQSQNYNINPSQEKEIQSLKKNYENLQNEYQKMLKNYATISQIDLDKFQFLLPKQKGLINQYFDQKIFERKNQFLLNQNRILKQLNEELVNSSQNLQAKRLSETHVMKQLLKNYNELVNNLKHEQKQLHDQAQLKDEENQILIKKFQKQSLYVNKLREHHQQIQKQVQVLQKPNVQDSFIENSQQNFTNNSSTTNKKQAKLKQKYKQNDVSMHFEKLSKGSIEPIQPKLNESNLNNSIYQKMYKQLQVEKNNDIRNSQKTLDLNQENIDLQIHDISDNSLKNIIKDQNSFIKYKNNQKLSNYSLYNYPQYSIDKNNLLSLKASSLFNNSLLFKNDLLQISCLSNIFIHRSERIVSLKLQYTPLQPDLKISTRIESLENIQSVPQFIINQYFETQLEQEFTFKTIGQFKNSTFQKLLLKITQGNNVEEINIPLPFTFNKFIEFDTIDSNQLDNFLAQAKYLKESLITIDHDIIPSFESLVQIFPSIITLSETQFLLYIKFDYTKCMVLNMCLESENQIKLDLLGKKMVQEFEWFYQWFTWIFTN